MEMNDNLKNLIRLSIERLDIFEEFDSINVFRINNSLFEINIDSKGDRVYSSTARIDLDDEIFDEAFEARIKCLSAACSIRDRLLEFEPSVERAVIFAEPRAARVSARKEDVNYEILIYQDAYGLLKMNVDAKFRIEYSDLVHTHVFNAYKVELSDLIKVLDRFDNLLYQKKGN